MNFDLHLYGETPEELLNVLAHLGHMDSNYHTPIPDEHHPAQAPAPQPQSMPAQQPDKPKAQTPAKQKKPAQEPAAAPAEEPANPTEPASAPDEPQEPTPAQTAPSEATATAPSAEPGKDPATKDKIRSLIMALMKQGKTKECKAIITSAGAASISAIKPESYTAVWEQLCKLSEEVNQNAAD